MGITQLLQRLKPILVDTHINRFKNMVAGVDTFCWLHKSINERNVEQVLSGDYSCMLSYTLRLYNVLKSQHISCVLVFDGDDLELKRMTNKKRNIDRKKNAEKSKLLESAEKSQSLKYLVRSVDITPDMTNYVIQGLKQKGIKYLVAPYEADAQLAYLNKAGIIDFIISEDSDLIVFGSKKIAFKFNPSTLQCQYHDFESLNNLFSNSTNSNSGYSLSKKAPKTLLNATGFALSSINFDIFQDICIFSGCDYLTSIRSIGLIKSYQYFKRYRSFDKVMRAIRREGKLDVDPNFEQDFIKAKNCFKYQQVFSNVVDPNKLEQSKQQMKLVTVSSVGDHATEPAPEDLDFRNEFELSSNLELVWKIGSGEVNPITKEVFKTQKLPVLLNKQSLLKSPELLRNDNVRRRSLTSITKYLSKSKIEKSLLHRKRVNLARDCQQQTSFKLAEVDNINTRKEYNKENEKRISNYFTVKRPTNRYEVKRPVPSPINLTKSKVFSSPFKPPEKSFSESEAKEKIHNTQTIATKSSVKAFSTFSFKSGLNESKFSKRFNTGLSSIPTFSSKTRTEIRESKCSKGVFKKYLFTSKCETETNISLVDEYRKKKNKRFRRLTFTAE